MIQLAMAIWKHAACWWRRKQTSPRGTGAAALSPLAMQSSTHFLRCSGGDTALQDAINRNKADVVAYLRSIGAPQ